MNDFSKKANSFIDGVTGLGVGLYTLNTLAQNPVSANDVVSLGTSLQETNNRHSSSLHRVDGPHVGTSDVPRTKYERGI